MKKIHAVLLVLLFIHTNAFTLKPAAAAPATPPKPAQDWLGQTVPGGTLESWLTDTVFQRMTDVYADEFQVVTKGSRVVTTNPGGFYYNVLFTAMADVPDLVVTLTVPEDFALWGDNPVHVWVDGFDVTAPDDETAVSAGDSLTVGPLSVTAGSRVFVTGHVRYSLASLPSPGYLPRVYTFSASATGAGVALATSASMMGVLKK